MDPLTDEINMNTKFPYHRSVLAGFIVFGFLISDSIADEDVNVPEVSVAAESVSESLEAELLATDFGGDAGKKCDCGRTSCCCGDYVDWTKTPQSIRPMARPGDFPVPPTGCGYYSVLDHLTGTLREGPPKSGYAPFGIMPPSFFDTDFRYVESMDYSERTFAERLKRIPLTDCLTFSTGGQFWARYMHEHNSRLMSARNEFTLARVRAYGDLMYGDRFRAFAEFIWADSIDEDLAPLPIDENRGDLLNLFVEAKLFEYQCQPVYARVGRQELLLGSQRLVSTLDWANTRRTFEGVRVFRNGEKWDLDAFYSAFVPPQATRFDERDDNQEFGGLWATYKPRKGHFADFYYLYLSWGALKPASDGRVKIGR